MSQDNADKTPADTTAPETPEVAEAAETAPAETTPAEAATAPTDAPTPPVTEADVAALTEVAFGDDVLVATPTGPGLAARLGAEAFGTFLLVLAGVGTALYASVTGATVFAVAVAFGFALVAAIASVGHISGGHFNPAVTLGAVLAGRTPARDLLPYWLVQVVAGIAATAVLFVVANTLPALDGQVTSFFAAAANGYGEHSPIAAQGIEGFPVLAALLIEFVATAVFVGVILAVTDRRASSVNAAVVIGLTLAALLLVAIPVTNGGLNPARSLAAAVFSGSELLKQVWVFWVAPLLGAAVAALVYRAFATSPALEDDEDEIIEVVELV
ncbi:aquaporin [Cellulomonas soli]|uniref:aquaporin n=1 Tax=Cellulomonas soli TaxID=931535 RepID=UPI003F857BAE